MGYFLALLPEKEEEAGNWVFGLVGLDCLNDLRQAAVLLVIRSVCGFAFLPFAEQLMDAVFAGGEPAFDGSNVFRLHLPHAQFSEFNEVSGHGEEHIGGQFLLLFAAEHCRLSSRLALNGRADFTQERLHLALQALLPNADHAAASSALSPKYYLSYKFIQ